MSKQLVNIQSEIGELEAVVLHTPGAEVENMTPSNAQRALYSDIINVNVAKKEHSQLSGVLSKICHTYQISDLLLNVLENSSAKQNLLSKICQHENASSLTGKLLELNNKDLCRLLIEGVPLATDNLTNYLFDERYSLKPLYNFYFTRDASVSIDNKVLICKMANAVRDRESLIMQAIFESSGEIYANTIDSTACTGSTTIEGGDILIARDDILLIGNGVRTNTQGIDFIISNILNRTSKTKQHIIVQQLPSKPESFIHLDMVFTLLDRDKCMVYEPLILQPNGYRTIHITIDNGKVTEIRNVDNILVALKSLGMDLKPICCGGSKDAWIQAREQWHSGANFVSVAPGKVIGYARNNHTVEEMDKNGFEIIAANDIISNKVDINNYSKYLITIDCNELPRGGGGARCMTMPISRKPVQW